MVAVRDPVDTGVQRHRRWLPASVAFLGSDIA